MPKKEKWSRSKMSAPSTSSISDLWCREKGFILDCIAVDSLARGANSFLPNLNSVIPAYSAQKDQHLVDYFAAKASSRFHRGRESWSKEAIVQEEDKEDEKEKMGPMAQYLMRRNRAGAGHSIEEIQGHDFLFSSLKPVLGYNGPYGYRRNCPTLRKIPATFGVLTHLPIH
ncbi:sperm microtubule associated protein 1-like [Petaurus breviceps papuanus]|uniref:sperm microtubule associated protein 1-like n=1 Tax=Petaurus breviceps papuanus TaxID=3040969 RepID=UPI0036D9AB68